jgi:hypothetical protein
MVVEASSHGRGFGRTILNYFKTVVQSMNVFDILSCADENAVGFFHQLGFVDGVIRMDPALSSVVATLKVDGLTQAVGVNVADLGTMFLNDSIDAAPLQSLLHIKAIFAEIKRRYVDIPNLVMKEVGEKFTLSERVKSAKAPRDVAVIYGNGFSIGVAASQDRPNAVVPTKDQMFELYKMRYGKVVAQELFDCKQQMKKVVQIKKEMAAAMNKFQAKIEEYTRAIKENDLKTFSQFFR